MPETPHPFLVPVIGTVTAGWCHICVLLCFSLVRPFWLSPRQARVVPVVPKFDEYAKHVAKQLYEAGFESEADLLPGDTMNKKIRNAQLEQWNYILGGCGQWVEQCVYVVCGCGRWVCLVRMLMSGWTSMVGVVNGCSQCVWLAHGCGRKVW